MEEGSWCQSVSNTNTSSESVHPLSPVLAWIIDRAAIVLQSTTTSREGTIFGHAGMSRRISRPSSRNYYADSSTYKLTSFEAYATSYTSVMFKIRYFCQLAYHMALLIPWVSFTLLDLGFYC
jgi:hypothetical protein